MFRIKLDETKNWYFACKSCTENEIKNNKIILTIVALFVIFVSYLLLPTFYNQTDISKKLKNELQVKYDLNFEFSQNIK